MDPMDILMFCVVGLSVLVFLVVQDLELLQESKTRTAPYFMGSVVASDDQEEEESVEAEKQVVSGSFNKDSSFQETRDEETENQVDCIENSNETFDDWEGIERTELEKIFGEAVVFLSCKSNADKIDGDLKLLLYGLQKVALDEACHGSQPMAFNVSARAKWNAWQKLGDMSREMAMEKYVNVLVKAIPEWKSEYTGAIKDVRSYEDYVPLPTE